MLKKRNFLNFILILKQIFNSKLKLYFDHILLKSSEKNTTKKYQHIQLQRPQKSKCFLNFFFVVRSSIQQFEITCFVPLHLRE